MRAELNEHGAGIGTGQRRARRPGTGNWEPCLAGRARWADSSSQQLAAVARSRRHTQPQQRASLAASSSSAGVATDRTPSAPRPTIEKRSATTQRARERYRRQRRPGRRTDSPALPPDRERRGRCAGRPARRDGEPASVSAFERDRRAVGLHPSRLHSAISADAIERGEAAVRSSAAASRSRAPTSTTCASDTGRNPGMDAVSACQHRPVSAASAVPSRKPLVVVSGVLKSACASSQMTPMSDDR